MTARSSSVTITDLFCGAGGSSQGAEEAGAEIALGLNHWPLAVETHAANFRAAAHECADVQATDPRRYFPTTILIASPECTNHSLAKGQRRKAAGQRDFFAPRDFDPAAVRSRATMWDVVRFAEAHRYELVLVENVVDVRYWECWEPWLAAMHALGYRHECVYLNAMFAHPTPQSRDRVYVVFWKRGNRAPDLQIRPPAFCGRCDRHVESVQSWKPGRTWGRYKRQYVYCCPVCGGVVEPYYFAALNAIDWTLPAERIGDRKRALKGRTLERIRFGLARYGRTPLVVRTNMTSGVECRVRAAGAPPLDTQPGSNITALVAPGHPMLIHTRNLHGTECRVRSAAEPVPTQTGCSDFALVSQGALMSMRDAGRFVYAGPDEAVHTQVATASQTAIISRAPFLVSYYANAQAESAGEAMRTVTVLDRHAVVQAGEEPAVEDCYFRMLAAHEVGRAMAFRDGYVVMGNARDRVKQYGNAVCPPVMLELVRRAIASLDGAR